MLKKLLNYMGIEADRVKFEHISASEAVKYTEVINGFTETVSALGPHKFSKQAPVETEVKQ